MRLLVLSSLLFVVLFLPSCGGALRSQPPPPKWTTGFWFWNGSAVRTSKLPEQLDVVFFQVGVLHQAGSFQKGESTPHFGPWAISAAFPDELPSAREHWLVIRFNRQAVPALASVPVIVQKVVEFQRVAEQRRLNLVGLQLDIDSPTESLAAYADFLRVIRKALPSGVSISITSLPDWFRDGTAIADVIKQVDEFVPQFYDVGAMTGPGASAEIAAKFDGAKWGPIFNRFERRFRIGIASFGRARLSRQDPSSKNGRVQSFLVDVAPADVAGNAALNVQTLRNEANELVLTYRVLRQVLFPHTSTLSPGDTIEFIVPTAESIESAVANAKQMGGYCAGVLFFRWPELDETLTMDPDEVLAAAGIVPQSGRSPGSVRVADGGCAAVTCMDLYLQNANPLRSSPVRFGIHSSTRLEYFVPKEGLPIRMVGPSDLEVSLPAYGGRRSAYLGRAVALATAQFTVREQR